MMLTQLDDALRAYGLDVVEVDGWKQRGHGHMTDVRGVTCHHTASGRGTGATLGLSTIVNGRPGLDGPLAHLYLNRAGVFYVVAAGLCWHAGVSRLSSQTNGHRIGIEALAAGDGWSGDWPDAQMDAYALGCKALADWYGFSIDQVLGHKETCAPVGRKPDPRGNKQYAWDMGSFRDKVRAARKPGPKPSPPKETTVALSDTEIDRLWTKKQELTGQAPAGALHEVDLRTEGGNLRDITARLTRTEEKLDQLLALHVTPPAEGS